MHGCLSCAPRVPVAGMASLTSPRDSVRRTCSPSTRPQLLGTLGAPPLQLTSGSALWRPQVFSEPVAMSSFGRFIASQPGNAQAPSPPFPLPHRKCDVALPNCSVFRTAYPSLGTFLACPADCDPPAGHLLLLRRGSWAAQSCPPLGCPPQCKLPAAGIGANRVAATELTVDSHPLHLLELWFPRQWRHTFLVDSTNMAMVCDGYKAGDGTPAYPEVTPVDLRDVDTFFAVNNHWTSSRASARSHNSRCSSV